MQQKNNFTAQYSWKWHSSSVRGYGLHWHSKVCEWDTLRHSLTHAGLKQTLQCACASSSYPVWSKQNPTLNPRSLFKDCTMASTLHKQSYTQTSPHAKKAHKVAEQIITSNTMTTKVTSLPKLNNIAWLCFGEGVTLYYPTCEVTAPRYCYSHT